MNDVKFYLGKRASDTDKTKIPVVLAFNFDTHRLYKQTRIKVKSSEWNPHKMRVKSQVTDSVESNTYLDRHEKEVREVYLKGLAEGAAMDIKYFKDRLSIYKKSKTIEQTTNTFFEDWEKFLNRKADEWTDRTLITVRVSLNHFKKFCNSNNISPNYEAITPDLLTDFRSFLLKTGQVNNSVLRCFKGMKFFLNDAYRMGKHKNILYREFKLKEYRGTVHYLTWEEVMKIYNFEKLSDLEKQVRDFFCFGAFTGLRFGDRVRLLKSQIKIQTIGGEKAYFIEHREQKTSNANRIPLMREAVEIINRYSHLPGDLALPDLNNQVANKYIKKIAKRVRAD
jgi:integrase